MYGPAKKDRFKLPEIPESTGSVREVVDMRADVKTTAVDQASTTQRLLNAAFRAFAERGFHGASIRDICECANTNIATAYFHFHNKEELYKAVLECVAQRLRAQPFADETPTRQTPQEKLCAAIQSLSQSLTRGEDSALLMRLVGRELAEQGPGFDCIAAALRTHVARLEEPLRALHDPDASHHCVHLCALSVVNECIFFCTAQSSLQRLCPDLEAQFISPEQLINHVAHFTAAAMANWKTRHVKYVERLPNVFRKT